MSIYFIQYDKFINLYFQEISEFNHAFKFLQAENGKDVELTEVGPRFQLRLYEIKLGTLESSKAADTEWALRPYMNTAKKRRFLSEEDGFEEDS